ncbi:MAG: hypothetical protein ACYTHJ_00835 [Planctomycetota bacterium]|jgi:hypothetical protein
MKASNGNAWPAIFSIVVIAAMAAWTPQVFGQELKESTPSDFSASSATVEAIMTQAVKNIGKRYSLNAYQLRQTDELMKREVRRFLIEHEAEIWPAIRSMISYGMGTKPPEDSAEAKQFAEQIKPLVGLAQKAIFDANGEWREILTPQQKAVHDFDMREMSKTFEHIDKSLTNWENGNASDSPIFRQPSRVAQGPPQPDVPPIDLRKQSKKGPMIRRPDPDILTTIVEQFIKDYQLDGGQITSAQSILDEFRGKAKNYESAKKSDFAAVASRIDTAIRTRDVDARKTAEQDQKKLLRPFYEITQEMEERLRGLLTSTQMEKFRERYDEADVEKAKNAREEAARKKADAEKSDAGKGSETESVAQNADGN